MRRLAVALSLLCLVGGPVPAQDPTDIRNPTINSESEQGALITQAGMAEEAAEKIQLLETFAGKYSDHSAMGYVYLQLQGLYLPQNNFDKVIDYGKKLIAIVPADVEVRHNLTKGYEGKQDWDALLPHLIETKPYAEKDTQAPEPEYEDEVEAWTAKIDYAKGVIQYIEYSLYTSVLKITDPQQKIAYFAALREHYPEGQYAKQAPDYLVQAYQQLGDFPKMLEEMEKSLANNPNNEGYLFTLADSASRQAQYDKSKGYAEQLLQVIAQKPMPDGQTEETWAKHKELFTTYGNLILGKLIVLQAGDSKPQYREGRKVLLTTVDTLTEKGGEIYGTLAYLLGVCYVKLDIGGDNINVAKKWMGIAAQTPNPYQQPAAQTLAAIQKATE
jgi:tetratricopeptide (TPR) repeat protein